MNTLVFVMIVFSHGGSWVPTLEFTSEQKCVAAAAKIKVAIDPRIKFGSLVMPICVGIEK